MISEGKLEELLKTKTIAQVANGLNITVDALSGRLKSLGISARDIKESHAESIIKELDCKYTINEMVTVTGFSRRKVLTLVKKYGVRSKFSYEKV